MKKCGLSTLHVDATVGSPEQFGGNYVPLVDHLATSTGFENLEHFPQE
jgi:hypothetical protein